MCKVKFLIQLQANEVKSQSKIGTRRQARVIITLDQIIKRPKG